MVVLVSTNLEVDVNGEEIFLLDKNLVSSFSIRLQKLFGKSTGKLRNLKVIFHEFPGGTVCFELISRFCYSQGNIEINSSNVLFLHCAAIFLEMPKLINQTQAFIEKIHFWTWSELIVGLRQCQDLLPSINSSHIREILNCLIGKYSLAYIDSPSTYSSDSSKFQFSGEISTKNSTNSKFQTTWWFEDLMFLNIELFERIIKTMLSYNFDQAVICSFLFYYQKSRNFAASSTEKCKITETIINLLSLLDKSYITYRSLLGTFGLALSLKVSKSCRVLLDYLIGSRLDQATIDELLVRSPSGKKYAYDVNLILRLLKVFLGEISKQFFLVRVKKVAGLIDSYLAEVAPDPYLKPSKFVALAAALPDFARESHDRIYRAVDMYLEVHTNLCEEEKVQIFSTMNYNKLSAATLKHLAHNPNFQSGFVVTVFASQLTGLLKGVDKQKISNDSPFCDTRKCDIDEAEKIIIQTKISIFQPKECSIKHIREKNYLFRAIPDPSCKSSNVGKFSCTINQNVQY